MALMLATAISAADDGSPLDDIQQGPWPRCDVFVYTIEPVGFTPHPECLFPLPEGYP